MRTLSHALSSDAVSLNLLLPSLSVQSVQFTLCTLLGHFGPRTLSFSPSTVVSPSVTQLSYLLQSSGCRISFSIITVVSPSTVVYLSPSVQGLLYQLKTTYTTYRRLQCRITPKHKPTPTALHCRQHRASLPPTFPRYPVRIVPTNIGTDACGQISYGAIA